MRRADPRHTHALAAAALLLATLVAYWPTFSAGYIWDDPDHVHITDRLGDLEGLARIWAELGATPQYYPLVHTTFWFEIQAWGLHPTGFHVVNALLHAANAILLYALLRRLNLGTGVAVAAAAIFALHPVMVESVAWISERKNVLSLCCYLGAMHAYLSFRPLDAHDHQPARPLNEVGGFYGLALLLFVAALLSKTVTATWPAAVLVLVWWKRGRIAWRDVPPLLPFFVLGVGAGLITVYLEKHHVGAEGEDWSLSPLDRVLLAGRVPWFYAGKLLWPRPLMFFYERWTIDASAAWQYAFPIATAALLAVLFALRKKIGRGPLAGVLLFGGTLFPALGLFDVYPFRFSFVADHFQYHASIPFITLVVAGVAWLMARAKLPRAVPIAAAALVAAVLGAATRNYTHVFKDEATVWLDTIDKNPRAWAAYYNLANLRLAENRLDEAIALNRRCLELRPNHAAAEGNLAAALAAKGDFASAMNHFARAIELNPRLASTYVNRGMALAQTGDFDRAAADLDRAIELQPDLVIAYQTRAAIHLARGRVDAARADLARMQELGVEPPAPLLHAAEAATTQPR